MIDYLELLLEEAEPEEESLASEWKPKKRFAANQGEQDGAQSELGLKRELSADDGQETVWALQKSLAASERLLIADRQLWTQGMAAELLRLHRAVRQAERPVVRTVERGGGVVGGDIGFSWMTGKAQLKTADYAALVDAAFARDARRYDGLPGLL